MTTATTALTATGISRVYPSPSGDVQALEDVSLDLHTGELLVVRGPSGSGKTTLLNILGGLDAPTAGTVHLGTRELTAMAEAHALDVRRRELSYIFQSFGLIPVLSAAENVEVPLRLLETEPKERDERVAAALELVGLGAHANQRPYELSGGQQQRVGIARALVTEPQILIADEPTGQLDSGTAATIMELLSDLTHARGLAAVVSTHDPLLMARADRVVELHDGQLRRRGRHTSDAVTE
ncbi:ABC transporter ATP-binding protein [Occultella glacieicola]|uniref:ABC transporter ATP-binding protein n=1 Tax=Occultella glacieicola TaxID=2518684 RepID=A0ABY2E5G2_9MICO|nr:ABC transporter ATP-binding protein [Occultella glacieicola]TDE95823.1 ABC transporter ATP-binding protein [Occultella glacieicola]